MRIIAYVFFLLSIIVKGQNSNPNNLNNLFNNLEKENQLMGTISITKNGKEAYFKPFGFYNISKKSKPNRSTKYRIGSITKTFTASIVLQLVDEGKLSLNTPLSKYFPQIPNASLITIKDLLNHQSGLFNVTKQKNIEEWISKPQSREQMLTRFVKNGADFEPRKDISYSNTNYILLSYIAEEVDNKSYAKILEDRIIKPLNLKRTAFGKAINHRKNEALAYYFKNNNWKKFDKQTHMSAPMGAGAITSTTEDLATFYNALFNSKVISDKSLKQMTMTSGNLGLGISEFQFKGMKIFGHSGGIDGFESYALYIPQKKVSIAILTNGVNTKVFPIVIKVLETYFKNDKSLQSSSSIQLTSKDLDKYLGVYAGKTFPAKVTFTKKGNTLFAQATGQPIFELLSLKKDVFKYDSMGLLFEFSNNTKQVFINIGGKKHLLTKE